MPDRRPRLATAGRSLSVALLSPCFWPEVMRGGERITHELAAGLLTRGHSPRLITSHPGPLRRTTEDGLPIIRLPRPPQQRLLRRMYEPYLTHVPLSYAVLLRGRYEIAHAVHTADALAATRWKRRTGRLALLSYMGIPDRPGLRERRKRLELMLSAMRGCDAVVALSEYAGEAFRRWLGYEARVIQPGVDTAAFRPLGGRSAHPTIICAAAADEPRKHVKLLVEAFKLVRREHATARLILFAPPDFASVRRLGVDVDADGVEWRDAVESRDALAREYNEAWVGALPAVSETFGLVLVESLACGTPVVGYDDAAIPEIIDRPEVGRLFTRLEPRPLADALLEALELSSGADTQRLCSERAEEFSTDRFIERYLALYRELGC
jgi:phosphatidyl-myo-inositol alpha-mannosyltransferase